MSIKTKILAATLAAATLGTTALTTSGQAQAHGWGWGPAVGVGIAAGTILGAAAATVYGPGYYYDPAYPRCHPLAQYDAYGRYIGSTRVCDVP
jgi:hypothetical protein